MLASFIFVICKVFGAQLVLSLNKWVPLKRMRKRSSCSRGFFNTMQAQQQKPRGADNPSQVPPTIVPCQVKRKTWQINGCIVFNCDTAAQTVNPRNDLEHISSVNACIIRPLIWRCTSGPFGVGCWRASVWDIDPVVTHSAESSQQRLCVFGKRSLLVSPCVYLVVKHAAVLGCFLKHILVKACWEKLQTFIPKWVSAPVVCKLPLKVGASRYNDDQNQPGRSAVSLKHKGEEA